MSKKIGCVIAYRKGQNNYGTSLQGYAMLKVIQRLGYEVEVINYIKNLTVIDKIRWMLNAYRCGFATKLNVRNKSFPTEYKNNIRERTATVDSYKKEKLLPLFHDYIGYEALCKGSNNYDAIVVGSDQVWFPTGLPTKFFNLLFVDDSIKKIAYASSFGVQDIPKFQRKATGAYLDRFYKIGVREQRGKEIVEKLSHKHAQVVVDPTLLLSREEWEAEIVPCNIEDKEPYMFCYLISENEDARAKATELALQKGLKIICIRHLEKYRAVDETYGDFAPYNVGPNHFVKYIRNAEYVVTDSFHCTVFSHIFHKRFLTFYRSSSGRNSRNSRIDSLISVLGSNPNHIFSNSGLKGIDSNDDWEMIDKKLLSLREQSIKFLKDSLS